MEIRIVMENPGNYFEIPLAYQYQLQSAIYAKLREIGSSDFWHNEGFGEFNKFKAFTFSPLAGKHEISGRKIIFTDRISFEIRSCSFYFCDAFQRALELNPVIRLFDAELPVCAASLLNYHINSSSAIFLAISPVVVHRQQEDGSTLYLSPLDEGCIEMLKSNIARKYEVILGKNVPDFEITPSGEFKKVVTRFKDIWITGYKGAFSVNGPYELLELIYNVGLGTKNAEGFGVVKVKE